MAKEIFISYSRKDFDEVRKIKDLIDKELDIDCWMDIDGIESDAQFVDVIVSAINSHEVILFMMSANSMTSKWTRDELALAERNRKRIVLIDLDHSRMPDDFFLLYNSKEKIEWSNHLQRDKLLKDLKRWLNEGQISINTSSKSKQIGCAVAVDQHPVEIRLLVDRAKSLYFQNCYNEAFALYLQAAKLGDPEAQAGVASCYYYGKGTMQDMKEALNWYRLAANQNHAFTKIAKKRVEHIQKRYSYLLNK